ncbi:hypothetical protein [Paraliobacillus ryukyuensis]|uniref:hypothetical protein n=1 Tax=Paraliobacillus ryukyuensis TaxID=200904 RepID=UPI0009A8BF2E|nr:hypothetical protein [Paraliobacillus ryukyuensis]
MEEQVQQEQEDVGLQEEMTKDRNRPHYEKGVLIEELWEEDKNQLKALPVSNLPIYSIDSLFAVVFILLLKHGL